MHTLEQLRAGALAGSRRLNLACGLEKFPEEIFALADTLEILDLSGNALESLPDDLPRLHKLRVLFCSNNLFTRLPEVLGHCPQLSMVGFKANRICHVPPTALPRSLRWLILTDNQIAALPAELGNCAQLQKLMLSGNRLQALPEELAACTQLELLRIAANHLAGLPDWLFELPRLAWLAYAGNPFCADGEAAALQDTSIRDIAWSELNIRQRLGEGASGVIHEALWQGDTPQPVAVKLFKGALTSDGLPHNEMASCISAGSHPNLISALGRIHGHPAGVDGLAMVLIDANFRNLAGPPSLDSCTRDIYDDTTAFTCEAMLRIALGIASAAGHLHARGIMHGDLYAHNILYSDAGDALLGDFGAASFLTCTDERQALSLQRIEVRAFACLLEELLQCGRNACLDTAAHGVLEALTELQMRCAHEIPARRPLFAEIRQTLQCVQERSI